jgi:hypothetical protein
LVASTFTHAAENRFAAIAAMRKLLRRSFPDIMALSS